MIVNALPSAAQIILYMDARASVFETAATALGLGLVGEIGSVAAADAAAYAAIMGDGTTGNPGLGNASWQNLITTRLLSAKGYARYDYWASKQALLMRTMDDIVGGALPAGTKFAAPRYLDGWLTRLNGANGTAPATPTAPGVLTAVTNAGGHCRLRCLHLRRVLCTPWLELLTNTRACRAMRPHRSPLRA